MAAQLQKPQSLAYRPPRHDDPSAYARLTAWYDGLSEVQRIAYGVGLILFLLACSGYLLGLGSTILLRRVEAEELARALNPPAVAEPTVDERPTPPSAPAAFVATATSTVAVTPRAGSPLPLPTPFAGPQLTQGPLVPRVIPAPQSNGVPIPAPPRAPTATLTVVRVPTSPPATSVVSPVPASTPTAPPAATPVLTATPAVATPPPVMTTPTVAAPPTATAPAKPTLPPPATPTQAAPPATAPPRPTNTPPPGGGAVAPGKP